MKVQKGIIPCGACSFADMLRDIDLMVSHLPELFKELGLTSKRIALGGMSAGGHLSLLYAYDGANPSVLGLGLRHALPVARASRASRRLHR